MRETMDEDGLQFSLGEVKQDTRIHIPMQEVSS